MKERYVIRNQFGHWTTPYSHAFLISLGPWSDNGEVEKDYKGKCAVETAVILNQTELDGMLDFKNEQGKLAERVLKDYKDQTQVILINAHGSLITGEFSAQHDSSLRLEPEKLAQFSLKAAPHVAHLKIKNLACYGGTSQFFDRFESEVRKYLAQPQFHPLREVTLIGANNTQGVGRTMRDMLTEENNDGRTRYHFYLEKNILKKFKKEAEEDKISASKYGEKMLLSFSSTNYSYFFVVLFYMDPDKDPFVKELVNALPREIDYPALRKAVGVDPKSFIGLLDILKKFEYEEDIFLMICARLQTKKIKKFDNIFHIVQACGLPEEEKEINQVQANGLPKEKKIEPFKLTKKQFEVVFALDIDFKKSHEKSIPKILSKLEKNNFIDYMLQNDANEVMKFLLELEERGVYADCYLDEIKRSGLSKLKAQAAVPLHQPQPLLAQTATASQLPQTLLVQTVSPHQPQTVLTQAVPPHQLQPVQTQTVSLHPPQPMPAQTQTVSLHQPQPMPAQTPVPVNPTLNPPPSPQINKFIEQIMDKIRHAFGDVPKQLKEELAKLPKEHYSSILNGLLHNFIKTYSLSQAMCFDVLLEYKADIFYKDQDDATVWHTTAQYRSVQIAQRLWAMYQKDSKSVPSVNLPDCNGITAFHLACQHCQNNEVMQFFLGLPKEKGKDKEIPLDILDVTLQDKHKKNTGLHLLNSKSSTEAFAIVKCILQKDEKAAARVNQDGLTPLDTAFQSENYFVAFAILKNGKVSSDALSIVVTNLCFHDDVQMAIRSFILLLTSHPTLLGENNVKKILGFLKSNSQAVGNEIFGNPILRTAPFAFHNYFDAPMCLQLARLIKDHPELPLEKLIVTLNFRPTQFYESELDEKLVNPSSAILVLGSAAMEEGAEEEAMKVLNMLSNSPITVLDQALHYICLGPTSINGTLNGNRVQKYQHNIEFLLKNGATITDHYLKRIPSETQLWLQRRVEQNTFKLVNQQGEEMESSFFVNTSVFVNQQAEKMQSSFIGIFNTAFKNSPPRDGVLETKDNTLCKMWNLMIGMHFRKCTKLASRMMMDFLFIFYAVGIADCMQAVKAITASLVNLSQKYYDNDEDAQAFKTYLINLLQMQDAFRTNKERNMYDWVKTQLPRQKKLTFEYLMSERKHFFKQLGQNKKQKELCDTFIQAAVAKKVLPNELPVYLAQWMNESQIPDKVVHHAPSNHVRRP